MNLKNIVALVFILTMGNAFAQINRSKLPEPTTPRPINIGDYESFELKNGLKVFVIENHKLPRVSFNLLVDRIALRENDKVGYLDMVGQMMERGTETRSKEQLDEEIDFIGASITASSTNVFASGLSKYQDKILELMTDMLFNPSFPEEELEKIRTQTLSSLAQAKETPSAIANNLNTVLVYGATHPYGEIQTEETTNNIKIDDLKAYHDDYFRPNISYLAIVGDVNYKKIKKSIKAYFGRWKKKDIPTSIYDFPKAPKKNQVGIVDRSSSVQSVINITYPTLLPIGSDEAIKVRVMNQILGGSFSGKLNMNLREDKGYTYGSRSSLAPNELISRFNASADVRNEVTDSAIVEILYEMEQMKKGEVTEEELELAKNSIAGNFSQSLERPQTVASFALNTARYGLPTDYYNTYIQKIQTVTVEDVKIIATRYLKPKNVYINVVGKASEVAESLKQFGEITYYDTYGNEIDPSLAKLPKGLTAEKIISDYKKALGGDEVLSKIENVVMEMEAETFGQKLPMMLTMTNDLKSKIVLTVNGQTVMEEIATLTNASTTQMGQAVPLEAADKEEIAFANSLFGEFKLSEVGAKMKLIGIESIKGKDAYVIGITLPKGAEYSLYFDKETGLKTRLAKVIETPNGVLNQIVDYQDYQEINGMMMYHQMTQQVGPQKIVSKVKNIKINQELAENMFKIN